MKKRFIFFSLAALMTTAILTSCDNSNISIIETNTDTVTSAGTSVSGNSTYQTKSLKYEPVYENINIDINTTNDTNEIPVEDTVDLIYDSVTSITATSTSSISMGSGVLFAKDDNLGFSYLLTCFHVIEGAYSFVVTEADGDTYEAYLVGGYEDEDLAVLAIKTPEENDLCYSSLFENSDTLRLGSTVICIGNPLGTLPGSVSKGVVSYKNRKVSVDTYQTQSLIQTDVAINSGNSGGGLFNAAGALIGIVSAKYSSTGIEGLGFAIPSNTALDMINKIFETAKYDTANKCFYEGYYSGDYEFAFEISLGTYTSGYGFNQQRKNVLYVSSVNSNNTYSGTDLNVNDIIQSISIDYADNNKTDSTLTSFSSVADIMNYLLNSNIEIGDTITFNIIRSNQEKTITFNILQYRYSI